MSVQIIITGETAGEALIELSTFSAGLAGGQAPAATPEAPKTRQSRSKPETKPEEPKTAAPETPPADEGEEESAEDVSENAPTPTDVELREVASRIGAKGADAKKAIKALLDKYGVPNLTAVPAEKRTAFKAELEGLA